MDMAQYYSVDPDLIAIKSTKKLSTMYSAMLINKASERIRRIEEISVPYMKEKTKEKFIDGIFKEIDDKYKDPHMVDEDELKRIFNNGGR
tara:strand:+ start:1005 stop:1274 length:270 start_codon:yes stop_codon:yes gene_type:complete